jgi:eukaryotic-like serine/threonine-protein kinase
VASIQRFGRYTVTGTLGSGSMGDVYSAVDDVLGRKVAIKTLRSGTTGLAAQMIDERFRVEARAIAALNHPGIVQVYDIDLTADPPYLVMECLVGPSLRDRFKRGPLAQNELRALGIQIGRALSTAHTSGIVHRDVKPGNIIVAGDGVLQCSAASANRTAMCSVSARRSITELRENGRGSKRRCAGSSLPFLRFAR